MSNGNAKELTAVRFERGTHHLNDLTVRAVLYEGKPGDIAELNALVKPLGLTAVEDFEYNQKWIEVGKWSTLVSNNEVWLVEQIVNNGEYLVKAGAKLFTMSKEAFETLFTPTYAVN